jgi:hypothetical protein
MMRLYELHDQVLRDLLRLVPAVVLGVDWAMAGVILSSTET